MHKLVHARGQDRLEADRQRQLSTLALELTAGKARTIYDLSSLLPDGFQQFVSQGGKNCIESESQSDHRRLIIA